MAPSKASRKGKKAWRKNIDTKDVEQAAEDRSREERQITAVDALADSELFFIDKSRNTAGAAAVKSGTKRRRQRERKPLRCDVVAAASKVRPVLQPPPPKRKAAAKAAASGPSLAGAGRAGGLADGAARDLWAEQPAKQSTADADFAEAAQLAVQALRRGAEGGVLPRAVKRRRLAAASKVAAVEVDAPGCSFNPDRVQHQDAVAAAVAAEVRKALQRDLAAQPPPRTVDWQPETDALALLQVDADNDDGDKEASDGGDGDDEGAAVSKAAARKKTRVDRNREQRRRDAEAATAARAALKAQRRDLQGLDSLAAQVDAEAAAAQARAQRRAADRAEREQSGPVRLGKHRFQPAPVQVLLTEEITGSLRKLKPAPMLARERFSSLQKRGVIEPRVPVAPRGGRGRISYTAGEKGEKTRQGHAELMAERKAAAAVRR